MAPLPTPEKKGPVRGRRTRAREAAVQALYQWQLTGQSPSELKTHLPALRDLEDLDRDYLYEILGGVLQGADALDLKLAPHLDRPVGEVDPVERAILRLGAWELDAHPEIPYRVVLNEAVALARQFGAEQGHKYVNAVLDRVAADLRAVEKAAAR